MNGFVLVRDDGQYVTPPGRVHSYTKFIQGALIFRTREEAELNRCVENETIRRVEDCLGGHEA